MRLLSLWLVAGCASQIRTELVTTGNGVVTTRTAAGTSNAPGIPLPRGTYNVDLRFGIPRAQVVDWKINCPGADVGGSVGETFDAYRERRLKQLEADREQQRKNLASTIVGPRPPAILVTPVGRVVVRGQVPTTVCTDVDPTDAPLELAPGDDGRGVWPANVQLSTTADGTCTITATADDQNVRAFYAVTRLRDLRVEAAEHKQTLYVGAVAMRGKVSAQLVALGADGTARQRRLDAQAKARAEAEARAGAELARRRELELQVTVAARQRADALAAAEAERVRVRREAEARLTTQAQVRAQAEARAGAELLRQRELELQVTVETRRRTALTWRTTYVAWLVGECHADPNARRLRLEAEARVRAETEARAGAELVRRRELELRVSLESRRKAEAEAAIEAEHDRQVELRRQAERTRMAELERRHTDDALHVRVTLVSNLVAYGGKIRPPRPALLVETPGSIPFEGAVWTAGRWSWISPRGEWVWSAGGWSDPGRFAETGGEVATVRAVEPVPVETVHVETVPVVPTVVIGVGVGRTTIVGGRPPLTTVVRKPPTRRTPVVREHRDDKKADDNRRR